jgi:hypothetical protein
VRKETAVLKQGEKKLLTNGGAGPPGSTAIARQSKGIYYWTQRRLTVDPPARLFAGYNRDLAATGYAVIERHRQCLQGRGEVESAQHLRA